MPKVVTYHIDHHDRVEHGAVITFYDEGGHIWHNEASWLGWPGCYEILRDKRGSYPNIKFKTRYPRTRSKSK